MTSLQVPSFRAEWLTASLVHPTESIGDEPEVLRVQGGDAFHVFMDGGVPVFPNGIGRERRCWQTVRAGPKNSTISGRRCIEKM